MQSGLRSFDGLSGRTYVFARTDPNNLSPYLLTHGVFILAKDNGTSITPIYIGEAESIYGEFANTTRWSEAKLHHDADAIFCHLLADPARRVVERQDLIDKWQPPLN